MRRKDREMDRNFALDVIDRADYGSLALVENGQPYVIPLSFARYNDFLYFHSATSGRKVELLNKLPYVSISFVGKVEVPDLYSDRELSDIKDKKGIKSIVSRIFTTEYESAIVSGRVIELEDKNEKIKGLRHICQKYTPDKMEYFLDAVDSDLKNVNVYFVKIDEITGKRKKYDRSGEEMKWRRLE